MKTISKILSVVLCLTMVLGLFVVGASAAGDTYTKVNSISEITAGTYVIGGVSVNAIDDGSNYAFLSNVSDGKQRLKGTSLTENNGVVTTNDTSVVWNLVATDGGFYLQNAGNGKYVTMPALKKADLVDSASDATVWAVVEYNGGITLKVSNSSEGYMTANRFGSAGSYYLGFAAYKASSQSCPCNLDFYKLSGSGSVTPPPATEETTPSTEATTPSETPSTGLNVVAAPVAGTAYKFGMVQQNVSATDVYYLKGGMDGFYMATSSNVADAIDVYLEETTGGYYLYTMEGTTKTYINMVVSGTHVNGAYEATASTVYRFDETSKTLIAVVNDSDYWFGTRNDKKYTTVGPCATSYNGFYCQFYAETSSEPGGVTPPPATEETTPSTEATTPSTEATTPATKPSTTLAPVVKPVAGTAYKFALVQAKLSKTLYFNGKMDDSGKFFGTTENAAEAVDVYLEAAQGGYYFYFMDGTTKTYLSLEGYLDNNGKQKAAVKLTAEATTVFTYSEDAKTFIHTIGDTSFYLGTYGTYNTMSASSTYYITGEKAGDVGVSQFVSTFYAPAGGSSNTGDASFISVAAAVLVLSVIGGTALIIKKKEN